MSTPKGILFTAFEPSGDALAAPLIRHLREIRPDVPIWALGGSRMRDAGAEIIESTTGDAVMLAGTLGKVTEHQRRLRALKRWLMANPIDVHVPVDSPAANWSICKLVRDTQPDAKIVHLVAPQVWAWATWRVRKLRRLTNHVLCLLPFESQWLTERNIPCTFVGHPLMDSPRVPDTLFDEPHGGVKHIGLLPGSRMAEIHKNWPTQFEAFMRLREKNPKLQGEVAAIHHRGAALVRRIAQRAVPMHTWTKFLKVRVGQTEDVLRRSDLVLVTSGTATLEVAAHRKPMVVIYNVSWLSWQIFGRWLVATRTFSLPNLIGKLDEGKAIVPEFVPHFGSVEPFLSAAEELIENPAARRRQREDLDRVRARFHQVCFTRTSAETLLRIAGLSST